MNEPALWTPEVTYNEVKKYGLSSKHPITHVHSVDVLEDFVAAVTDELALVRGQVVPQHKLGHLESSYTREMVSLVTQVIFPPCLSSCWWLGAFRQLTRAAF